MNTVISVENLSKAYQLGAINTGTFRGDLQRWWANLRGLPNPHLKIGEKDYGNRQGETLWALKDVNLSVQQGEILGIIGSNGAGKSTLLKILSRVTAPTSGVVKVKGRIASLLEVGTGFHPELTGRENIYLNGAILGMNRTEITRKFDEIVDFSGVEGFIDTPVKRYSSGMYVRLAFAVAAHLDPDILVIDEVLAVGDLEFQNRCLNKMNDVSQQGRTVILVSHNMGAILRLAENCILLDKGQILMQGPAQQTVDTYASQSFYQAGERYFDIDSAKDAQFLHMVIRNPQGEIAELLDPAEIFIVEAEFVTRRLCHMYVSFMIEYNGMSVFHSGTFLDPDMPKSWPVGRYRVQMIFPANILNAGKYTVWAGLAQWDGTKLDTRNEDGLTLNLSKFSDIGTRGPQKQTLQGVLSIDPEYRVVSPSPDAEPTKSAGSWEVPNRDAK